MQALIPTEVLEVSPSHLVELALAGLEPMYDHDKGLFCHRVKQTASGMVMEGVSYRYTMMTLLGLLRARSAGFGIFLDIEAAIDRLLARTAWVDNVGDLGLLLWLSATSEQYQKQCHAIFNLREALEQYPDARRRMTMELSWLLTGLSQASIAKSSTDLGACAHKAYDLICANRGESGLFGHMARWRSAAGIVRGNIGSFADQVYPIVALSHFSRTFGVPEAYEKALRCAERICRLQGQLGQWWWHYDATTGRIVEHYPVYSVHQHAMGPMAFLTLQAGCQANFDFHIRQGLNWVHGRNELQLDLKGENANVIWRCVRPQRSQSYVDYIRGFAGQSPAKTPLSVLQECRPYELGWLLYALSERVTPPSLF